MSDRYRRFEPEHLCQAWSLLNEYYDFCRMAYHRRKLEEQLRHANIPLTHVPWKSMVRALLCQDLFSDTQLKEMMNENTEECLTVVDIAASEPILNLWLNTNEESKRNLTETWFEIDELKQRFQQAMNILPATRSGRKDMLNRILGYPIGYVENEFDLNLNKSDDELLDLTRVLTVDEQRQMSTGDVIELSGNRLHDAFYIYRLPQKGIWKQIQQMWSKHQITDFIFNDTLTNSIEEQEIILIPAMDEYGYGVPYLFATRPTISLPDGALYKYVDINYPLVSKHTENSTIAIVQKHLNERLKNPIYNDKYIGAETSIDLNRFPQQYVAFVHIREAPKDNVVWTHRIHYNSKQIATDLNDNCDIFYSRRILEAEEQYQKKFI